MRKSLFLTWIMYKFVQPTRRFAAEPLLVLENILRSYRTSNEDRKEEDKEDAWNTTKTPVGYVGDDLRKILSKVYEVKEKEKKKRKRASGNDNSDETSQDDFSTRTLKFVLYQIRCFSVIYGALDSFPHIFASMCRCFLYLFSSHIYIYIYT